MEFDDPSVEEGVEDIEREGPRAAVAVLEEELRGDLGDAPRAGRRAVGADDLWRRLGARPV